MLMIAQLCGDAFSTLAFITAVSLRQSIAPDRLLGRTSTAMQVLIAGVAPIGALAGGLLAEAIGVRVTLLIAGIGIMLSTGWLILSPIRGLREPPDRATLPGEAA